jgi:RNA polymerase sigma factor (sigma-70 family)
MTAASPPDNATEAQVAAALARCAAGDRTALRVIYDAEAPRMAGVARRMLRRQDLAEEAVQDAFMRVWRAAGTFDPQKGAARSWLYAILRNCALSILRDENRFTSDEDAADQAAPMTENALAQLPETSALRRCQVGESGRSERTFGLLVSGNYFSVLGLRPAVGRFVREDEAARPGGEPVVVISHAYWQKRFAGAATALGQTIRVNDRQLTVIGITPERFQGTVLGLTFDLWAPATLAPVLLGGSRELEDRTMRGYQVMGMLQPHVSLAQAQTEVDHAMRELAQLYPETNAKVQAEVRPFWQATRGPQRMLAGAVMLMQGLMLLLLLAVCGNTANLVLARASARHREMGMRLALGAGPWRVVSLLLAESLLLSMCGAVLGVVIAAWATSGIHGRSPNR